LEIFRAVAITLPQLIILLILGASFDLLLGFNRTDAGFNTLLFLFVLSPVVALIWFIVETANSIRLAKRINKRVSFLLPGLAFFFFLESLAIDFYMILSFKM
jgi:hypothetical protein